MDFDKTIDRLLNDGEYVYTLLINEDDENDGRMILAMDLDAVDQKTAAEAAHELNILIDLLGALKEDVSNKFILFDALAQLVETGKAREEWDENDNVYRYSTGSE